MEEYSIVSRYILQVELLSLISLRTHVTRGDSTCLPRVVYTACIYSLYNVIFYCSPDTQTQSSIYVTRRQPAGLTRAISRALSRLIAVSGLPVLFPYSLPPFAYQLTSINVHYLVPTFSFLSSLPVIPRTIRLIVRWTDISTICKAVGFVIELLPSLSLSTSQISQLYSYISFLRCEPDIFSDLRLFIFYLERNVTSLRELSWRR